MLAPAAERTVAVKTRQKKTDRTSAKRDTRPKPLTPAGVEPLLVDTTEAAALLGVSTLTVALWTQSGILRSVPLPPTRRRRAGDVRLRRVLYSLAELRRLVAEAEARG